ncbi:MAG: hypothetical protein HQ402_00840 [Parcubacteria group bacterium]|nr:hypothetical protein [Parcubacteria group bacterium]
MGIEKFPDPNEGVEESEISKEKDALVTRDVADVFLDEFGMLENQIESRQVNFSEAAVALKSLLARIDSAKDKIDVARSRVSDQLDHMSTELRPDTSPSVLDNIDHIKKLEVLDVLNKVRGRVMEDGSKLIREFRLRENEGFDDLIPSNMIGSITRAIEEFNISFDKAEINFETLESSLKTIRNAIDSMFTLRNHGVNDNSDSLYRLRRVMESLIEDFSYVVPNVDNEKYPSIRNILTSTVSVIDEKINLIKKKANILSEYQR